ncbi:MAG: helicase-associated domain-containing protein [Anaerolineae bacterium]
MKNLRQCLIDCDMAMLRAIAQRRGVELTSNRQREVVEQLAEELAQLESIADVLERLEPQEREALESLVSEGGRNKLHLFVRQYGEIRAFGPGSLERERPWGDPVSAAEGLWYSGLIYRAFDEVGGKPRQGQTSEFVFVPQDLLPLLPEVEKRPPAFVVETAPTPSVIRQGDLALVQDTCAFLSYLQNEDVKPLKDGSLTHRDMEHITKRFLAEEDEEETERLAFLHHLCQRLGLVHTFEGFLKPNPPEAKRWLKAPRAEQLRALQEAWRDDPDWNELWRVKSLRSEPTGWRNDPLLARKKILEHLAKCPPEQWLSLASFTEAIKEDDPDFQRPDGDYTSWYIREVATGQYLAGFEHWDQVEGALIAHLVTKLLHWLGATSLGYDAEGAPRSFLITPWGAAFLGLPGEMPAEAPLLSMIVQPNFTIIAPAGGSLYDRFQLERVAAWQSSGESYVYRITRDSLACGLRQGIKIEMILAFLKRVSGGKVPRNVVSALRNWDKRRGQIQLRKAFLLQVESEPIMEELSTSPQTRAYLQEIISPKAAIIAQEDWPKLLDELRKLGYLPKVDGE